MTIIEPINEDETTAPTKNGEEWLVENRELRMDANKDIWNEDRRIFHLDRYQFAKNFCNGGRVLDGACGTGYGTAILAKTAAEAVGIDMSEETIEYATRVYGAKNIRFERSFVEYTPFETASFDVVVSFETIEHTLCPKAHMSEIARLLRPDSGRAVLSVPNAWGYTDHHFFDFDTALLKQTIEPFFDQVELFAQIPGSLAKPASGVITALSTANSHQAQCIVAVCSGPKPMVTSDDRLNFVMEEIYENVFDRHQEFRTLLYRQDNTIIKRVLNRLRLIRSGVPPV